MISINKALCFRFYEHHQPIVIIILYLYQFINQCFIFFNPCTSPYLKSHNFNIGNRVLPSAATCPIVSFRVQKSKDKRHLLLLQTQTIIITYTTGDQYFGHAKRLESSFTLITDYFYSTVVASVFVVLQYGHPIA